MHRCVDGWEDEEEEEEEEDVRILCSKIKIPVATDFCVNASLV